MFGKKWRRNVDRFGFHWLIFAYQDMIYEWNMRINKITQEKFGENNNKQQNREGIIFE